MKKLTVEFVNKMAEDAVEISGNFIGYNAATAIVAYVLESIEHPDMRTDSAATQLKDWLARGHDVASWLRWNQDSEFAVRYALPGLFAAYDAATKAKATLAGLEASFMLTAEVPNGDAS